MSSYPKKAHGLCNLWHGKAVWTGCSRRSLARPLNFWSRAPALLSAVAPTLRAGFSSTTTPAPIAAAGVPWRFAAIVTRSPLFSGGVPPDGKARSRKGLLIECPYFYTLPAPSGPLP